MSLSALHSIELPIVEKSQPREQSKVASQILSLSAVATEYVVWDPAEASHRKLQLSLSTVRIFILLYYSVASSFRVAFKDSFDPTIIVDYAFDFMMLIDAVLRLKATNLFPFNHPLSYLRRWTMIQRVCVVLALAPLDIPFVVFGWKALYAMRLLKLIHLQQLYMYTAMVYAYLYKRVWVGNPLRLRLLRLIFEILLIMHVAGCAWYLIGDTVQDEMGRSWLQTLDGVVDRGSTATAYLASIYWAGLSLVGVGYGDFFARTIYEMCFAMLVVTTGWIVYGVLVAYLIPILHKNSKKDQYVQRMERVKLYMRFHRVSSKTRKAINQYFDNLWRNQRGIDNEAVLEHDLPLSLKREVCSYLLQSVPQTIPLFQGLPSYFFQTLAGFMRLESFFADELILNADEINSTLFIISTGHAVRLDKKHNLVLAEVHPGTFVGDASFVLATHPANSVRTTELTDCFTLSAEDFGVLKHLYRAAPFARRLDSNAAAYEIEAGDTVPEPQGTHAGTRPTSVDLLVQQEHVIVAQNLRWHILLLLGILYSVGVVSFRIAFWNDLSVGDGFTPFVISLLVLDWLVDAVFIVDLCWRLYTSIYTWKSRAFLMDTAASLPLELLALQGDSYGLNSTLQLMVVLRMNRVLRLWRFPKFVALWKRWVLGSDPSRLRLKMINVVVSAITCLMALHCVACGWYWLAETESGFTSTWLYLDDYGRCIDKPRSPESVPPTISCSQYAQYARALYWSATSAATIGFGNVIPFSDWERLYATLAILLVTLLYFLILTQLYIYADVSNQNLYNFERHTSLLHRFLRNINLPVKLQEKVQAHNAQMWHVQRGARDLLADLPRPVQRAIRSEVIHELLKRIPMLDRCQEQLQFLEALSTDTETVLRTPGEHIGRASELAGLFFVYLGSVDVFNDMGERTGVIRPGTCFGEDILVKSVVFYTNERLNIEANRSQEHEDEFVPTAERRPAIAPGFGRRASLTISLDQPIMNDDKSYFASSHCLLYLVSAQTFYSCLKRFPEVATVIMKNCSMPVSLKERERTLDVRHRFRSAVTKVKNVNVLTIPSHLREAPAPESYIRSQVVNFTPPSSASLSLIGSTSSSPSSRGSSSSQSSRSASPSLPFEEDERPGRINFSALQPERDLSSPTPTLAFEVGVRIPVPSRSSQPTPSLSSGVGSTNAPQNSLNSSTAPNISGVPGVPQVSPDSLTRSMPHAPNVSVLSSRDYHELPSGSVMSSQPQAPNTSIVSSAHRQPTLTPSGNMSSMQSINLPSSSSVNAPATTPVGPSPCLGSHTADAVPPVFNLSHILSDEEESVTVPSLQSTDSAVLRKQREREGQSSHSEPHADFGVEQTEAKAPEQQEPLAKWATFTRILYQPTPIVEKVGEERTSIYSNGSNISVTEPSWIERTIHSLTDPYTTPRLLFEVLKGVGWLYFLAIIPLRIGMDLDYPDNSALLTASLVIDAFFDIVFFVDVYLRLYHISVLYNGEVVTAAKAHRFTRRYVVLDLVACNIFDNFLLLLDARIVFWVRLLRLLKGSQVYFYWSQLEQMFEKHLSLGRTTKTFLRAAQQLFLMLFVAHWLACFWYFTSKQDADNPATWINQTTLPINAPSGSLVDRYLQALYFCLVTMSSVGYGDIAPNTDAEVLFTLLLILVGVLTYVSVTGNIASLLANTDAAEGEFHALMDRFSTFCHFHPSVPPALRKQVSSYFRYLWKQQSGRRQGELLGYMPSHLQEHVAAFLHGNLIENIHLFQDLSPVVVKALARLASHRIFAQQQHIVSVGDVSNCMYIISKGEAEFYRTGTQQQPQLLTEGDVFGVPNVLSEKPVPQTISALASSVCETLTLNHAQLKKALGLHYDSQVVFWRRVQATASKANKTGRGSAVSQNARLKRILSDAEHRSRPWVVMPDSGFHVAWKLALVIGILFYGIVTPLQTLFAQTQSPTQFLVTALVGYSVDVLFWADIYLHLRRFVVIDNVYLNNRTVHHLACPSIIFQSFLNNRRLKLSVAWMLVSVFPFELVYTLSDLSGYSKETYSIIRLSRFLLVLRLPGLVQSLEVQLESVNRYMRFHNRRLLKLGVLIMMVFHWTACLWLLLGDRNQQTTWLTVLYDRGVLERTTRLIRTREYAASMYWTVVTLTTCGYGDVTPTDSAELVFAICAIIVGNVLFADVIGTISMAAIQANHRSETHRSKVKYVRKFLEVRGVPLRTQYRVFLWLRYAHSGLGLESANQVLQELPLHFRRRVKYHCWKAAVQVAPFFRDCSDSFMVELADGLTLKLCMPLDAVFRKSECSDEMYMILAGSAVVLRDQSLDDDDGDSGSDLEESKQSASVESLLTFKSTATQNSIGIDPDTSVEDALYTVGGAAERKRQSHVQAIAERSRTKGASITIDRSTGGVFGDIGFFLGTPRSASVIASEEWVELLVLRHTVLKRLLQRFPDALPKIFSGFYDYCEACEYDLGQDDITTALSKTWNLTGENLRQIEAARSASKFHEQL